MVPTKRQYCFVQNSMKDDASALKRETLSSNRFGPRVCLLGKHVLDARVAHQRLLVPTVHGDHQLRGNSKVGGVSLTLFEVLAAASGAADRTRRIVPLAPPLFMASCAPPSPSSPISPIYKGPETMPPTQSL